ncbi:MAG TPA: hypothetical protein ENI94_14300 [Gammaproteobacteria bacterium]|nr:hypothetical protein [Gammaproteobacteria bacterium]
MMIGSFSHGHTKRCCVLAISARQTKNPENRTTNALLENTNKVPIHYNLEMFKIRRQHRDIWKDR